MKEGLPSEIEQAEALLTLEQEEQLENLGLNTESEEDKLLLDYAKKELATGSVDLKTIVETFKAERAEKLAEGGYDAKKYLIKEDGTVLTDEEKNIN